MTITVKRRFIPVALHGEVWEMEEFEATVWRHPPGDILKKTPDGYIPSLLVGYVDGRKASIPELEEALASIGMTRKGVLMEINHSAG